MDWRVRNGGLPLLIVDIHHRGQRYPTLALRAKRHQDAESLCEDRLRTDLSTLTFNGIPLCNARATMKVRLANPAEVPSISRQCNLSSHQVPLTLFIWWISMDKPRASAGPVQVASSTLETLTAKVKSDMRLRPYVALLSSRDDGED